MNKDSIGNTFFIALSLCLVCSAVVALAAIGLKPIQDRNKALDRKKNVLIAAGLIKRGDSANIDQLFQKMVVDKIVDLESGQDVTSEYPSPAAFDPEATLEEKGKYRQLESKEDIATLKKRENRAHVYLVKTSESDETPSKYVFPVRGKGLWSTMKGFLSLNSDLKTASGITFYEDGETPGLGGEINSAAFQAQWPDKRILDDSGKVVLKVSKTASGDSEIASLSGATITSNGVQFMIQYWLGDAGFGKYLQNLQASGVRRAGLNQVDRR
ncbi:MAG: Na(+)-translocating NADH-quinone reductase subunit C [Planctomycetota bacterium]|jgi:Na+-transporting NADH:ubiquinone oxidoreductase subunit C